MDSTIIAALIGVAGSLICVLAVGRLTIRATIAGVESSNKLAIQIMHRQDFNAAASEFRSAFKDELLALNPALSRNDIDTAELLTAVFDKHRLAVFDFRPFLTSESIAEFDKAWKKYYTYDNAPNGTVHGLDKYSGVGHGYKEKRRLRLLAAEQIERLFDFAVHI